MDQHHDSVKQALELFGLTLPLSQEQLAAKRRELLSSWYPARYANLTNNPKQYMQHYTKAEEMTDQIEAAYALLSAHLGCNEQPPS